MDKQTAQEIRLFLEGPLAVLQESIMLWQERRNYIRSLGGKHKEQLPNLVIQIGEAKQREKKMKKWVQQLREIEQG